VRTGIFGGTFDPIHVGHLAAAEVARAELGLARVVFVPAARPPHKDAVVAPAEDRLAMVRLAVADNPAFEVSDAEVRRPGPSFTVDTLRTLAGEQPSQELFYLLGSDSLLDLPTWHDPEGLCRLATFAVLLRPGWPRARLEAWHAAQPPGRRPRMVVVEVPALDVASRDLRRRLALGRTVRYLLPEAVRTYALERGLYR
jgi:nicotinate-nucleotide adenylyltransferase